MRSSRYPTAATVMTHPHRRGWVLTETRSGTCRSGPKRAWWLTFKDRPRNAIMIAAEIPTWRVWGWNVALAALEVYLQAWALRVGVTGRTLVTIDLTMVLVGVAYVTWMVRYVDRNVQRGSEAIHVRNLARQRATERAAAVLAECTSPASTQQATAVPLVLADAA